MTSGLFYGIMTAVETPERERRHIALNAHLLSMDSSYRGAGTHTYIRHLLEYLPGVDASLRYTAFLGDRRYIPTSPGLHAQTSWLPTASPPVRVLWEQLVQPLVARQRGVDLLHAMAYVGPLLSTCPQVVTVLDLSFQRHPQAFRPGNRLYLRLLTRISAQRAECVIAISRHTKADVVQHLGVPAERVNVVYCGVEDHFRPLPQEAVLAFRRDRSLPDRYLLTVGTLEPRKNQVLLLRAYARLRDTGLAVPPLVMVGGRGWLYEDIFREVERLELGNHVRFAGYVPSHELPLWYNGAVCFLYPSLYEGFGLPPLESMACGTPVLSSDAASLPEVVGDAGLLLNPLSEELWAEQLAMVLASPDLQRELGARGRDRARLFNWRRTAEETVQVYLRALAGTTTHV